MNAKKAIFNKQGLEFILINPSEDIPIETLCSIFGKQTIKVNSFGPGIFQIEALYGFENIFSQEEDFSNLEWKNITL